MQPADWFMLVLGSGLTLASVALFAWRVTPLWDGFAAGRMGELQERFEQLSMDGKLLAIALRLWGIALLVGSILLWTALRSPPLACVYAGLVYVAPRIIMDYLIRRQSQLLRAQLVPAALGVGNAVKAGLSLAQSLQTISEETPQPLAGVLRRIVFEFERGRPLKEAMENVRDRLKLEPFSLFSLAIETSIERGGRVNEALERISSSLQEQQRLERKLDAATSAGQQVVLVLALFPLAFLGMFYSMDPGTTSLLFTTWTGQFVLVAVIGLVYVGVRWALQILRLEL